MTSLVSKTAPQGTPAPAIVLTQLQDHQLAEGVIEIHGVKRASYGLFTCRQLLHERVRLEEFRGFVHGHTLRMHAYGTDVAAVAQQRLHELTQDISRVVASEALLDHHLLDVVRPSLPEGVGAVDDANSFWERGQLCRQQNKQANRYPTL